MSLQVTQQTQTQTQPTDALSVPVEPIVRDRIRAAFERDRATISPSPATFEEWLLAIVLDWVAEVEKPLPIR